ncbi:DUF3558 domain-containing protein [Nocardia sp. NEAU-G5]|uniref:DUF3558 domain-containing protein n=1 Tax=Nocardia albiluteola TaxID=2842303 RepID=A0ABS6BCB0_9NOCA|nr:DUF3558 domain-containing protein [Nocardia albiluteola]MBU3067106.1 DUF3558 domain-containing protein [Nocardia albiluteola]
MRALAVVAGACVVLAVAGCGKSTESGTPQASAQTLTPDQLWDPCSLPDSAVAATGVKADTKNTNPLGSKSTGWKACSWNNDTYFLDVDSTTHTIDEARSNDKFKNVHDVDVPGRKAFSYTEGSWGSCGVDFQTSKGLVELIVRQSVGSPSAGDVCAIALSTTNSLNNLIPK